MLNAKSTPNTCSGSLILRPKTLISFWDMVRILANDLLALLSTLQLHAANAYQRGLDPGSKADPNVRENLLKLLDGAEASCKYVELEKTGAALAAFKLQLKSSPPLSSYQAIHSQIISVLASVQDELRNRTFVFIPESKADFFEQAALFGEAVNLSFPSAKGHLKSAGNCLAADLHTATVYHLMCVVELGLRALSKKLHVAKVKKTMRIELGTWEDIIKALEAKVNGSFPRTKKGQQDLDFYKSAFIEYRAFKDFWRNKVMHARVEYGEHDALAAFEHVRAFMQRLAQRVSEN
jgi:hypothetical protein